MAENGELNMWREWIDGVDSDIIRLLAHRVGLVRGVADYKLRHNMAAHQPDVQAARRQAWAERAEERGLDPELATKIFDVIHEHSVAEQNSAIEQPTANL